MTSEQLAGQCLVFGNGYFIELNSKSETKSRYSRAILTRQ